MKSMFHRYSLTRRKVAEKSDQQHWQSPVSGTCSKFKPQTRSLGEYVWVIVGHSVLIRKFDKVPLKLEMYTMKQV